MDELLDKFPLAKAGLAAFERGRLDASVETEMYDSGFRAGEELERERIIKLLESEICWECAETRPVFAHNACCYFDEAVQVVKGVAE